VIPKIGVNYTGMVDLTLQAGPQALLKFARCRMAPRAFPWHDRMS
jgi:hypothetical protein